MTKLLYGRDNTIHRTKQLNVEVDANGQVVSVWFRCLALPFDVTVVDDRRADEMRRAYQSEGIHPIDAIEVELP